MREQSPCIGGLDDSSEGAGKVLMSGNQAIARGAFESGIGVACAYPGTPSTEILEHMRAFDGIYIEWSPNEKVALEVALGAAVAGVRALAAMKHVGLNVAADPLFTAAYTGVNAGLVVVSADDPGMHSSQNEQDNRHYARFARIPTSWLTRRPQGCPEGTEARPGTAPMVGNNR